MMGGGGMCKVYGWEFGQKFLLDLGCVVGKPRGLQSVDSLGRSAKPRQSFSFQDFVGPNGVRGGVGTGPAGFGGAGLACF